MDKLAAMEELDRRGKLPPDKKVLLDEARKRGLVGDTVHPADLAHADHVSVPADTLGTQGLALPGSGPANAGTPNQHFGPSASDTMNPLPAISALGDQFFTNIPVIGPYLGKARDQINASTYGITPEQSRASMNETVRQNPEAAVVGEFAGKSAPYVAASTNPLTAGVMGMEGGLGLRFLMTGLSSEALNIGDKVSRGSDPLAALGPATEETLTQLPFAALGNKGSKAAAAAVAPTVADLKSQAGALYKSAEDSQLVIAQAPAKNWIDTTTSQAMKDGLDEGLTPKSVYVIKRMHAGAGGNMTIQDAMLLRKVAGDAADTAEIGSNDQRISRNIVKSLDGFLGGVKGADIVAGDPVAAKKALDDANALWTKASKGQVIDRAIETAISRSESSAGGMSVDQTLRNEFGTLDREIINGNPEGFTKDEAKLIRSVARGRGAQRLARWVGKFAPSGVISAGIGTGIGAGIGHTLGGDTPLALGAGVGGIWAAGALGKSAAASMARDKAALASAGVKMGTPLGAAPGAIPQTMRALPGALGRGATMTLEEWMGQHQ